MVPDLQLVAVATSALDNRNIDPHVEAEAAMTVLADGVLTAAR